MIGPIYKNFFTDNSLHKNYFRDEDLFLLIKCLILFTLLYSGLKQCAQILGYNEGKVLELFKKTLPTRYYFLLFGTQNLRKAVESSKRVMTKEKLDSKLAGKSSNLYMSLKTYPSTKKKVVKFDEYTLLYPK